MDAYEPAKCGMCRSRPASGLVHINDDPVFICAACLVHAKVAEELQRAFAQQQELRAQQWRDAGIDLSTIQMVLRAGCRQCFGSGRVTTMREHGDRIVMTLAECECVEWHRNGRPMFAPRAAAATSPEIARLEVR